MNCQLPNSFLQKEMDFLRFKANLEDHVPITSNESPLFMLFNFIDNDKVIYTIQFDGE